MTVRIDADEKNELFRIRLIDEIRTCRFDFVIVRISSRAPDGSVSWCMGERKSFEGLLQDT